MGDDEHALAPILARDRINHAAQAQDHVAPTLAAGRTVVELAECLAESELFGETFAYAILRQTIKDAELFFTQPLVVDEGNIGRVYAGRLQGQLGRVYRAHVSRGEHDLRLLCGRHAPEPQAQRARLPFAQLG